MRYFGRATEGAAVSWACRFGGRREYEAKLIVPDIFPVPSVPSSSSASSLSSSHPSSPSRGCWARLAMPRDPYLREKFTPLPALTLYLKLMARYARWTHRSTRLLNSVFLASFELWHPIQKRPQGGIFLRPPGSKCMNAEKMPARCGNLTQRHRFANQNLSFLPQSSRACGVADTLKSRRWAGSATALPVRSHN